MRDRSSISVLIAAEITAFIVLCVVVVVALAKPKKTDEQTYTRTSVTEDISSETEIMTSEETTELVSEETAAQMETFTDDIEEKLSSMSIEDKVAQLFVVSPEQLTGQKGVTIAGDMTREAMENHPVGGLVYTYDNVEDENQIVDLVAGGMEMCYEITGYEPFVMADLGGETQAGSYIVYAGSEDVTPIADALYTLEQMDTSEEELSEDDISEVISELQPEQDEDTTTYPIGITTRITAQADRLVGEQSFLIIDNDADIDIQEVRTANDYHGPVAVSEIATGDTAVELLNAGADVLYQPTDFETVYEAVLAAAQDGTLTEEVLNRAVGRILTLKAVIAGEIDEDETTETATTQATTQATTEAATEAATTQAATTQAATTQAATTQAATTQAATTQATTQTTTEAASHAGGQTENNESNAGNDADDAESDGDSSSRPGAVDTTP